MIGPFKKKVIYSSGWRRENNLMPTPSSLSIYTAQIIKECYLLPRYSKYLIVLCIETKSAHWFPKSLDVSMLAVIFSSLLPPKQSISSEWLPKLFDKDIGN